MTNFPLKRLMRLPPAGRKQIIGLMGGSFNPVHIGHRQICELALKRLGLNQIWWLVTPGNPLKSHNDLRPFEERLLEADNMQKHPAIKVTGFEKIAATCYTIDVLQKISRYYPQCCFIWIMGADNLSQFHLWKGWQQIFAHTPILVVARPKTEKAVLSSPAARHFARWRLPDYALDKLLHAPPPAWGFMPNSRLVISSTDLR